MLTSVPTGINRSNRQVVLRHPNALPITLLRKQVTRVELDDDGDPSEMGGAPTLGGMGVLRSEDEPDFQYVEMGTGRLLYTATFASMDMNDRESGTLAEQQREALIASDAAPDTEGYFDANVGDILMVDMGMGFLLAFEVATATGTVNIPPYTQRYLLNPRDDLNYLDPPFGDD